MTRLALIVLCVVGGALAHDRYGVHIVSCEKDWPVREACVHDKMMSTVDMAKVKTCMGMCSTDLEKEHHHHHHHNRSSVMAEFGMCMHQHKTDCISKNTQVELDLDGEKKKKHHKRHHHHHHHHNGTDMIDGMLAFADKCGAEVGQCVRDALGAELLKDTEAGSILIKKAMCSAHHDCPASAACQADREAVKAATCKCQPEHASFLTACETDEVKAAKAARASSGSHSREHQPTSGSHSREHQPTSAERSEWMHKHDACAETSDDVPPFCVV
jgi:hypothetical protein